MSNPSSDNASKSERQRPERVNHDRSNREEQSDYYYDDATGYEIYEDKDDAEDDTDERQKDASLPL